MTDISRLTLALAGGLLALTLTTSAQATEYPPCTKKATSDDIEAAKGMHVAGKQYYAKALYERAIESWLDAYNFDCNAHRLLINIGNSYEKLGNAAEAIKAFDTYLERMGTEADPEVREKSANLKRRLQPVPTPTPTPTPAPAPTPNPQPTTPSSGPPIAPIVVMSAGGAAAIAGVVVLAVGLSDLSFADKTCPTRNACTDEDAISRGNRGRVMAPVGGVVMGVGLAAAAGGLVWLLLSGDETPAAPPQSGSLVWTPTFSAGPQGASAGVTITF